MDTVENNPTPSVTSPNSGYFQENDYHTNEYKDKMKRWWDAFLYRARQVWPWIYRLINFLVYEIIKVLKAIVRIALQQVGLMKGE